MWCNMSKNNTIVDLEMDSDGAYAPKSNTNKAVIKAIKVDKPVKKKYNRDKADNFIGGLDAGLDFVEEIGLRVDRFFRLRG
jgi:hypothetical protein